MFDPMKLSEVTVERQFDDAESGAAVPLEAIAEELTEAPTARSDGAELTSEQLDAFQNGEPVPLEVMAEERPEAAGTDGLELSEDEAAAIEAIGDLPVEADLVANTYITSSCEGCVGKHVGTGVRVVVHGS